MNRRLDGPTACLEFSEEKNIRTEIRTPDRPVRSLVIILTTFK
jgi:hypothetical protein